MTQFYAVIVAAGAGTRMRGHGGQVPKVLLPIEGCSSFERCVRTFIDSGVISGIVVAAPEGLGIMFTEELSRIASGVERYVCTGGASRQESVQKCLRTLQENLGDMSDCFVMIHDGARPFVSKDLIRTLAEECSQQMAVIPAVPVSSTVKVVHERGRVERTVPREDLWLAQTPQVFQFDLIWNAHERARAESFFGTDDSELVEVMGVPVHVCLGESTNLKVTTPDDLKLAGAIGATKVANS